MIPATPKEEAARLVNDIDDVDKDWMSIYVVDVGGIGTGTHHTSAKARECRDRLRAFIAELIERERQIGFEEGVEREQARQQEHRYDTQF